MAYKINEITHGGYKYIVGDRIKINNKLMYTSISDRIGNTFQQLEQCIMEITEIWAGTADGAPVRNPIKVKWVSGPSGSYNGNGFIRLEQIVPGSGGSPVIPPIMPGNIAVYPYDTRIKNTISGTWAEAFLIDWNSYKVPEGDRIVKYEIYYQEAPDVNNSPGAWSANVKAMDSTIVENTGREILGSVNQLTETSSWGTRGCWYRFSVRAICASGQYSSDLFSNPLRKCLASKITFSTDGGTGAPPTQYKFSGYSFVFPTEIPKKTGYKFKNWKSDVGAYVPGENVVLPDKDAGFVAIYENDAVVYVSIGETWRETIPYILIDGMWKEVIPHVSINGVWKGV